MIIGTEIIYFNYWQHEKKNLVDTYESCSCPERNLIFFECAWAMFLLILLDSCTSVVVGYIYVLRAINL